MVIKYEDLTDDADKKFIEIIQKHDCHVMGVFPTEDHPGPAFSYSTGLYHTFNQPEILIIGLTTDLAHSMINFYRDQLREGHTYQSDRFYGGFLEGFEVLFIDANEEARKEYATWSDWYYERQDYPLYQIIYPTTDGIWPWEEDASDQFLEHQPILGTLPKSIL